MNAQPDSLSRPVPSRRRFKTLMEEARRKRRGSVGTALTASTPTLSPSQAGGTDEFHRADAIHIAVPRFLDRKSTRLNSSHVAISYAVFCLKKKIKKLVIYLHLVNTKE